MPTREQIEAARQQSQDAIERVEESMRWDRATKLGAWQRPASEPKPKSASGELTTSKKPPEPAPDWSGWERWADAKIANAIIAEREIMLTIVGEALGELMNNLRDEFEKTLAEKLAALRAEFNVARAFALATDSTPLPNPLSLRGTRPPQ
jgi:hypothetical protein